MAQPRLYEDEGKLEERDPEASPIPSGKLITQPYDLVIASLMDQIEDSIVHLRHISERPKFQRRYVWTDQLASRLIESILLNVPIPPCYLAQNDNFELDVIDGQQRIYSIYRFVKNHFKLTGLEVLTELNGKSFHELQGLSRKITTYTLRCVVVTNDSDPEIRFEVFERLNSNTMPLNAQELRNSISRGSLIDLLGTLAEYPDWLKVLNHKQPDRRMRDEELILRFFAFYIHGSVNYFTPQKLWLDNAAQAGRHYSPDKIERLASTWEKTLKNCLLIFESSQCFRRLPEAKRQVVNRALMDLTMSSLANVPEQKVRSGAKEFYDRYSALTQDEEFDDLITRSIDHKSRTLRRFEIWRERVTDGLF